jgi:hypothetical protein
MKPGRPRIYPNAAARQAAYRARAAARTAAAREENEEVNPARPPSTPLEATVEGQNLASRSTPSLPAGNLPAETAGAPPAPTVTFCVLRSFWGEVTTTSAGLAAIGPDGLVEGSPEVLAVLRLVPGFVVIPDQLDQLDEDLQRHLARLGYGEAE